MAQCFHCSAPLPANTNVCTYCGTRNDVDLQARQDYKVERFVSKRICPNCDIALQTIRLNLAEAFFIERCDTCYGLFFDRGEVEIILHSEVSNVFDINMQLIDNVNKDRYLANQKVRYIKCPECRVLMNRVNFGQRSGVVVDQCSIHGIWLDSAELTHLLEWKKAGGQLLQEKTAVLQQQMKKSQSHIRLSSAYNYDSDRNIYSGLEIDLAEAVISVIAKLFD